MEWWAAREGLDPSASSTRKSLADRLVKSLGSEPERRMFIAYFKAFRPRLGDGLPALVPQVYLHYDPITLRELRARGDQRRFDVQRMDFLLLLPHNVRVVIEIDGQQHYSTGAEPSAKPSPEEYARTVRGDRHLRLAGYEVYRFGGYELRDDSTCASAVDEFFTRLFRRHELLESSSLRCISNSRFGREAVIRAAASALPRVRDHPLDVLRDGEVRDPKGRCPAWGGRSALPAEFDFFSHFTPISQVGIRSGPAMMAFGSHSELQTRSALPSVGPMVSVSMMGGESMSTIACCRCEWRW